jgi:hypothetical protein
VLAQHDILKHRHRVEEADDLKGSADPQFRAHMRLHIVQPPSLIENLSVGEVIHPADQIEERRLPGSVGADDGVDSALFYIDRNILQGGKTPEIFSDRSNFKDDPWFGFTHRHHFSIIQAL